MGKRTAQQGFTMVELVIVMVIVGILAAVAAPRFFEINTFDSRAYYDQLISTLRFAQKAAVAQHSTVCVVDTANEIGLYAADCTTPLNLFDEQVCATNNNKYRHKLCAPSGVTITSAHGTVSFDYLGRAVAKTYTVSDYATPVTVEAETGYVH
jgi:MSHA pilin protein MshC